MNISLQVQDLVGQLVNVHDSKKGEDPVIDTPN